MVYWLIGLSAAGKTTVGRALCEELRRRGRPVVFVDGDEIRAIFKHDQHEDAYSLGGRRANAERIREMCKWLDRQEVDVVCSILSVFEETHQWNRANLKQYFEVYIEAPIDVLRDRSPKNLYTLAAEGKMPNVVGVDIPFTPPASPDLHLYNGDPPLDIKAAVAEIIELSGGVTSAADQDRV